jgi:PiT family inorganic phosphate transporter
MSLAFVLVAAVAGLLAWANGANDVSRGIATLVGSGTTRYRQAILWGSIWTGLGGALGALYAGALLSTFGGALLSAGTVPTLAAALATLLGAATWVLLATRTGLPVSTTHAIVGALVGVAVLAYGPSAVRWSSLGSKVALPLLLAPLVSVVITGVLLRLTRPRSAETACADCVCVEATLPAASAAGVAARSALIEVTHDTAAACAEQRPQALRLTLGHLHWLTSGATSLARGMNDAPKIAALALAAAALASASTPSPNQLFALVITAMVAGSLIAGLRVTRVLAEGITPMDDREGFTANLVTAALVTTGAVHGLPMSTTHVSTGAIFGAGAMRGSLDLRALRGIVLAWVITLPAAALLGCVAYALTRWLLPS